ncbi:MAG: hypothetical protein FJX92_01590 [Bacteroidetes bacterium]|nr:hypothetical protein [Bacteroidota bacterium]
MKWYPFGEREEKSMENEMLWTSLALAGQEAEGQTLIHCKYVSTNKYKNGGWMSIYKTTFLVNADTKDMLKLVQAFDVPVSPAKHFFKQAGQLKQFTLLFPSVPKHWKRFHLLEVADGGGEFRVSDITRNDFGVYHVQVS